MPGRKPGMILPFRNPPGSAVFGAFHLFRFEFDDQIDLVVIAGLGFDFQCLFLLFYINDFMEKCGEDGT